MSYLMAQRLESEMVASKCGDLGSGLCVLGLRG